MNAIVNHDDLRKAVVDSLSAPSEDIARHVLAMAGANPNQIEKAITTGTGLVAYDLQAPAKNLFYGVFALTFLSGRRWLLALWALAPLVLVAGQALFGPYIGLGPDIAWFLCNPIDLLFGLGVCFGLAYVRWRPSWPSGAWAAAATAAGCAVVFGLALVLNYDRSIPWMVLIVGLASVACLAAACAVVPPRGFIGDLGRRFGDASYCIYLTHTAFVSAVLGLASHHARGLPDVVIVTLAFLIAALSGLALHYVAERPIVAWSQRLLFPKRIEGR